uniref:E3 ubiquitin protein ligase n=1 Tax=Romanomermis culicivorax TaxID=13658 RepID=A0A915KCW5_ROMCU
MASKRANSQENDQNDSRSSGVPSPASKKPRLVTFEPVRLPAISTVSELDRHTLVFQNRKLYERLDQKKRVERELRLRIDKLEQRQNRDDVFLCIINRHWNRLDEDVRLLLQRFDSETDVEGEWDREELDRELTQRVEFSKRDIAKLVKAFDRISQRNAKLTQIMRDVKENSSSDRDAVNGELLAENLSLRQDNQRLQSLISKVQEKNHSLSNNNSRFKDRLNAAETKLDECKKEIEESDFQLEKALSYSDKLEYQLKEMQCKLQQAEIKVAISEKKGSTTASTAPPTTNNQTMINALISTANQQRDEKSLSGAILDENKVTELTESLEEQRELASGRLMELQELTDRHVKTLQYVEQLKTELSHVPEDSVLKSTQYCQLQTQFSVLHNESLQCRTQLDDIRNQLIATKVAHLKQIEQMESEELLAQKQLRAEMVQLEDQLSQVRREYEMLRVEFEQNLAANEQSGPLNKEMRQLLASYKVQNGQFRSEVQRFKRKWKEAVSTIAKVQKELDTERKSHENCIHIALNPVLACLDGSENCHDSVPTDHDIPSVSVDDEIEMSEELMKMEARDLRKLVKKTERKCAELDSSLQAYKLASNEDEASKAEALKRLKLENLKLKLYVAFIAKKRGKDLLPNMDEPIKHSKKLEEQIDKLKKEVASCKQEEETLLNEMEVTGQAFEEMQEQNVRLVQQLKEKDDANFKLMSDRIKTNQQHKLLREEKDLLQDQVIALQNQVEAQNLVVRKLEEKENLLQQQLATLEKEIASRQQATDLHRRKAIEGAQSLADLKLQVEKLSAQLTEAQLAIATKTAGLEDESFKITRLQEEISVQRKRLERSKKYEKASGGTTDEILLEEIRELKEHLTCPSCKVRRKDGVLTKCYHVFCMDCLKTRYETRQRKCPKCNAAFGANDFKRIYIG